MHDDPPPRACCTSARAGTSACAAWPRWRRRSTSGTIISATLRGRGTTIRWRRAPEQTADRSRRQKCMMPAARVAVIHDWLTGMRGGEHVLEAILDLVPGRGALHALPFSRQRFEDDRVAHDPHLAPAVAGHARPRLPHAPAALPARGAAVGSARIRSRHLLQPLRGERRRRARQAAPLLLPHADALHLGPFRRLLSARREAAAGASRWRHGCGGGTCATSKAVTRFVANSNFVRERIRALLRPRREVSIRSSTTRFSARR